MIHTNFHEKETWVGDVHERIKEKQFEMLQKHKALDFYVQKFFR